MPLISPSKRLLLYPIVRRHNAAVSIGTAFELSEFHDLDPGRQVKTDRLGAATQGIELEIHNVSHAADFPLSASTLWQRRDRRGGAREAKCLPRPAGPVVVVLHWTGDIEATASQLNVPWPG